MCSYECHEQINGYIEVSSHINGYTEVSGAHWWLQRRVMCNNMLLGFRSTSLTNRSVKSTQKDTWKCQEHTSDYINCQEPITDYIEWQDHTTAFIGASRAHNWLHRAVSRKSLASQRFQLQITSLITLINSSVAFIIRKGKNVKRKKKCTAFFSFSSQINNEFTLTELFILV